MNIQMPDFSYWAYSVTIRENMAERTQDRIERALRDAFNQGYQLGCREVWDENTK